MKFILLYLALINAVAFVFMLNDKTNARTHRRRIPERTLFGVATLGGSVGILIGMYLLRHKTRHRNFTIGIPAILIVQFLVAVRFFL